MGGGGEGRRAPTTPAGGSGAPNGRRVGAAGTAGGDGGRRGSGGGGGGGSGGDGGGGGRRGTGRTIPRSEAPKLPPVKPASRNHSFLECVVELLRGSRALRRRTFLRVSDAWLWLSPDLDVLHWRAGGGGDAARPADGAGAIPLARVRRLKGTDREVVLDTLDGLRVDFILPSCEVADIWLSGLACLVPLGAAVKSRYRALQTRDRYDPLADHWVGIPLSAAKRVADYVLLGTIGRGAYGKVKIALCAADRHFYAVKILSKRSLRNGYMTRKLERKARGGEPSRSTLALGADVADAVGSDGDAGRQRDLSSLADADVRWAGGGGSSSSKSEELVSDLIPEIAIMRALHHPNVVEFKAVFNDESTDRVYIVVEYVSRGSIMSSARLQGTPPISEARAREVTRDVLAGLAYLHDQGVIHRDIKPDNLLHCADGTVKISDFGAACHVRPVSASSAAATPPASTDARTNGSAAETAGVAPAGTAASAVPAAIDGAPGGPVGGSGSFRGRALSTLSSTPSSSSPYIAAMPSGHRSAALREMVGTPAFTAPELSLFRGAAPREAPDPFAADMWSVGATLFYLVYGRAPFLASSVLDMYEAVRSQELVLPASPATSPALGAFLRRLMDKNPATRLTLREALSTPWLAEAPTAATQAASTPPFAMRARVLGRADPQR
ncbi:hypothetical protein MMPV_000571 [Pyropia vietnamensis]